MAIHVLEGGRTMGDALRDLDARALIRSHFILMHGDTISNAKLLPVLEIHKYVPTYVVFIRFQNNKADTQIFQEKLQVRQGTSNDGCL